MADENQGERRWVVEPPAPGEISFHMSFGEGVELTVEQEAALTDLMRVLESADAEVTGHSCSKFSSCTGKSCKPVKCSTFVCHDLTANLTGTSATWSIMGSFGTPPA